MKKILLAAGLVVAIGFSQKSQAQVRVGVNINVGHPQPVYYYDNYPYYSQPRVVVTRTYPAYYYTTDRDRYYKKHPKYNRYRHDNGLHKGWYKNKKYRGRY